MSEGQRPGTASSRRPIHLEAETHCKNTASGTSERNITTMHNKVISEINLSDIISTRARDPGAAGLSRCRASEGNLIDEKSSISWGIRVLFERNIVQVQNANSCTNTIPRTNSSVNGLEQSGCNIDVYYRYIL